MSTDKPVQARKKKRRWFYRLLKVLLFLILIPLCIFLLLQIPAIQNWAVDRVAANFSERLGSKVTIDEVDFSIFDGLQLNQFYLEDQDGDTLIYTEQFAFSLTDNLISLINNSLSIDDIELKNGKVNVITRKGETNSNIQKLLANLARPKREDQKEGDPLLLALNSVTTEQVIFTLTDENDHTKQVYSIDEGKVLIDKLDFVNQDFIITEIDLYRPVIQLLKYDEATSLITTENVDTAIVNEIVDTTGRVFHIALQSLKITDGELRRWDQTKARGDAYPNSLDISDLDITELQIRMNDLNFTSDIAATAHLEDFSFQDKRGFFIDQLSADTLVVNHEEITFKGFNFRTAQTHIENDLSITYNEFSDFQDVSNRVFFKSNFDNAEIGLGDITYFVKELNDNTFFRDNKGRQVVLDGRYYGRINKLSGRDVSLYLDNGLSLRGNFDSRNISDADNALVNIKIEQLNTNIDFLEQVIPGFRAPDNFDKIGNFSFQGRFDGYFKDFVAYGDLISDLGKVEMDMRLDVKRGASNAKYSGEMALVDFDLRRWTDDDNFGKVNFKSKVSNGSGLNFENAFADLNATVRSLDFKGYTYADFVLDGQLEKNKFEGVFKIDDDNAVFEFDGNISYLNGRPYLDFTADIEKLNFDSLNLTEVPLSMRGEIDIDMNGLGIDDMIGKLTASDLYITRADSLYTLDTISLTSMNDHRGGQELYIYSDIGTASISGKYNYNSIIGSVRQIIKDNYPYYTSQWPNSDIVVEQDFDFDISIIDTKNILSLLGIDGLSISNMKAKGSISNRDKEIALTSSIPLLSYNQYQIHGAQLNVNSIDSDGSIFLTIDSSAIGDRKFNLIDVTAEMQGDYINLNISTYELIDSLERVDIMAQIVPHDKGIELHLEDRELIMLGNKWSFSDENKIVFGKKYIDIEALYLTDEEKRISIKDIDEEGLEINLDNVDLAMINPFLNYDKMLLGGETNIALRLYKMYSDAPVITGNVSVDDFLINNDDFGKLEIDLSKTNENPYEGIFSLISPDHFLKANMLYDDKKKFLDVSTKGRGLPLRIFEFIITEGISETAGRADVDLTLQGPLDQLDMRGDGTLREGAVKVDYLGAKFFFDDQPVKITKDFLDFTDDIITDTKGNVGIITGGIRHDLFSEFDMDLNISADNAVVLNTTKYENPLYYGYAQGKISVDFRGPFDRANLKVNAVTGPNTVLNLPVTYYQEGFDESFIKFVDRDNLDNSEITIINSNDSYKIKGLNIEMNVTLTQDAQMRIIFDESRRDILEGRGNGSVQMYIDRFGAFDVFGEYQVVSGNYLFTVGPLVRKPFRIKPGGMIRWQGDPLNASLDIEADYRVRTPLNIFLAEYLTEGTGAAREAANSQVTELTLDLTGTIFQPKVNFDISFPQLQGELKTYADSKVRTLQTNEIALNSQVMGLIVSNSFLPTTGGVSNIVSNDFIESAGVNTLSELLSNQLSNLLTGLLTEALSDNGLISGIDFKVALRNNSGFLTENSGALDFNELEANTRFNFAFLNERLSVNVGGNYIRNDQLQGITGNYVAGNLVFEYFLTDERKLKLRLYGTSDIDFQEQQRRGKYGFGIGYRTEFGSLSEFKDGFSNALREIINEGLENQNGGEF